MVKSLRVYKVSCDGNFEEYIAKEIIQGIDSRFSINGQRYIGGFSTGGRGAVRYPFVSEADNAPVGNIAPQRKSLGASGSAVGVYC